MSVLLYIEGAGQGELADRQFRQAWSTFFSRVPGLRGRPRVIRGQGRLRTFDLFRTRLRNLEPGEVAVLLVDSEGPVQEGSDPWMHLGTRPGDEWTVPEGGQGRAFLMVQLMETWLLADVVALCSTFPGLRRELIQSWPKLEAVPKAQVLEVLDRATRDCQQPYAKGKISFRALEATDPAKVEAACPSAKRLFDFLRRNL